MKTKAICALLALASSCTPAIVAQSVASSARTVPDAPTAPTAPIAADAPTVPSPTETTAPNQFVYTARLPSVQELTDAAAAHGTGISRIEQTATQVTVAYQLANGRTNVVAYQLLPTAGANASAQIATPAPIVVAAPPPAIVYTPRQRVVYYDTYPRYDPWYWYPPVSLSFGFGFGGGHYGHHYRGGHGGFHHRHR